MLSIYTRFQLKKFLKIFFSSDLIGWYSTQKASLGERSLMEALSVSSRIFLTFEPVVDLASRWMEFRMNFVADLLDCLICSINVKNLLIRIVLICLVSLGMSSMSRIETFHVFSTMTASLLKRSHNPAWSSKVAVVNSIDVKFVVRMTKIELLKNFNILIYIVYSFHHNISFHSILFEIVMP